MQFVTLARLRGEVDNEFIEKTNQFISNPPPGIKIHNLLYTLGRFNIVIFYEAPNEKEAMRCGLMFTGKAATETLVAIPREEALKLFKG